MQLSVAAREVQLLFLLLGGTANDGVVAELIEGGIDWQFFGWLVNRERAAPVVQQRLRGLPESLVPEPVAAGLQRLATVTEFRMLRLEQRLVQTLAPLRAAGIDVILLKGAGLASTVYPSFGARPMGDLDLLVRDGRGAEAWELVRQVGWTWDHQESLDEFYARCHHYPPLDDADGTDLSLELHTALFVDGHPFNLPLASLWDTAEPVPVRGDGVYVLDHHTQMLHLCLHFAWSHKMSSASWRTCRDLGTLLETGRTDWDKFVELASVSRAATSAYWTLRLARTIGGLDVPAEVLKRLAPPGAPAFLRLLERHYLTHLTPVEMACPSTQLQWTMWNLGIRPRWSGHGKGRPWSHNALFVKSSPETTAAAGGKEHFPTASASGGIAGKLWNQLSQWRDWMRYLRILTGASIRGRSA